MKKILFFATLIMGLAVSCKKSSGGNASYHLTATIDGKNETFNFQPIATKTSINGGTYIAIGGFATSSPTGETFEIGLSNTNPGGPAIKTGTYVDSSSVFTVSGIYQVSLSEQYVAGTILYFGNQGSTDPPLTNHFKLVITGLDSTSIKGTFSGDFFVGATTSGTKKTVTNGDFYVKFF